ncbi:8190_t:CDS:2, partial [Paraglomus occultum]
MIHVLIYFINRNESGDGEFDLFGGFREYTILGQCKGGTEVTSEDVTAFEETLSRFDRSKTIAILIARYDHRELLAQSNADVFTPNAKARAKSSEYNIILTDELNV